MAGFWTDTALNNNYYIITITPYIMLFWVLSADYY